MSRQTIGSSPRTVAGSRMDGGDPCEDKEQLFCYPPLVTRLFAWTSLMTPASALVSTKMFSDRSRLGNGFREQSLY